MGALRNRGSAFSVVLAAVIVSVASLAGCVGTAQPDVTPGGVNTSAPETGTTAPQPDNPSQAVSVQLAQLPVGGAPTAFDDAGADTCVAINWAGKDDTAIPSRVTIRLTDPTFTPPVYDLANQGCEHGPDCNGFVFEAGDQGSCNLAIAANGSQDASSDPPVVSLEGTVSCLDGETAECDTFVNAVQNTDQNRSITLDSPPAAPATSLDTTEPPGAAG